MTTLSLTFACQPFARAVNTGSSPEARSLERRVAEFVSHFRRRAERDRAFSDLTKVSEQTADGWDSYGGLKPQAGVAALACRFLNTLPSTVPAPEVGIDPDGEISFEWIVSKDRQLIASLSGGGELSYAGIFGLNAKRGREQFDDVVPQELIEAIRRLGYDY